jgi:hypothetical protein
MKLAITLLIILRLERCMIADEGSTLSNLRATRYTFFNYGLKKIKNKKTT